MVVKWRFEEKRRFIISMNVPLQCRSDRTPFELFCIGLGNQSNSLRRLLRGLPQSRQLMGGGVRQRSVASGALKRLDGSRKQYDDPGQVQRFFRRSAIAGADPRPDPLNKPGISILLGNVEGRMAILIPRREVGSMLNKQGQCLRSRVPLGREMHCRSVAWAASTDSRAMCQQPGNRAVCPLRRKRLQGRSATRHAAIHRLAQRQKILGDVVGFPAVTLKMAKGRHEFPSCGGRSLLNEPADESQVPRGPAGAEQRRRIADSPIQRRCVHDGALPAEYFGDTHLSCHAVWPMSLPVRCTPDVQGGHPLTGWFHAGG
jgi:hypothetical protein